jgi:hypothetical protein
MSLTSKAKLLLEPLDISCTSTDCENNLHCFKTTKKKAPKGSCRSCGATLVDWSRVHKKDVKDAAHTFAMLKLEMIRHHFWHRVIDEKAVKHARRKGKVKMRGAVENRLRKALRVNNPREGRQTPFAENSIYYAQHATATCCRSCLKEWHDIAPEKDLSDEEIFYLTDLCVMFINERLPKLTEDGEKIPPTRRPKADGPSTGASSE